MRTAARLLVVLASPLAAMGPAAGAALPALAKLTGHGNESVRTAAKEARAAIAPK